MPPADRDHLERGAAQPSAKAPGTGTVALPATDPGARSPKEQRADLQRLLYELEGTLTYMGASHPQRAATEARRAQLQLMLKQLEEALQQKP
ncbi:MAG: hypothetical protein HY903_07275 [Deltaproteobacteria bacterium]|nr:hypothetical protein [Deltaproteobacteria bacterium]